MNTILSLQKARLTELQKSKKPDKDEVKALQDSVKYLEELNKLVLTTNGLALTATKPESEPLILKFSVNGTAFEVSGENAQKLAKKVVLTLVGSEPKVPSLVLARRQTHNFRSETGFKVVINALREAGVTITEIPNL
jgi:hypothetical protein